MGPFAFCPDRAAWLPEWSSEVAREQKLLSEQSAAILELIAAGHSYEQILARLPDLTYPDIFASAREALALLDPGAALDPSPVLEADAAKRPKARFRSRGSDLTVGGRRGQERTLMRRTERSNPPGAPGRSQWLADMVARLDSGWRGSVNCLGAAERTAWSRC